MKHFVKLIVHSKVGQFTGIASTGFETVEEALNFRNQLQETLRHCDSFTFIREDHLVHVDQSIEYTLERDIINNSVFEMAITTLKVNL